MPLNTCQLCLRKHHGDGDYCSRDHAERARVPLGNDLSPFARPYSVGKGRAKGVTNELERALKREAMLEAKRKAKPRKKPKKKRKRGRPPGSRTVKLDQGDQTDGET